MTNPVFSAFNPKEVPWQYDVKRRMRQEFDYRKNGVYEILLSGAVGSAKSIFAANMGLSHCLMYSDARLGLFRQTLSDLKETILATILEHLDGSEIIIDGIKDEMREGVHFTHNSSKGSIDFVNGAKIRSKAWGDRKYKKLRSHPYSAGIIEELTENDNDQCENFYPEVLSRIGRVGFKNSNVRENWLLVLTNPDGESHWGYNYFILNDGKFENRKVFYSLTKDNKFLDPTYIENLRRNLSPIQARRKLGGEWIDDQSDKIYSCYDRAIHYKEQTYKVNPDHPIHLTWDFNIGKGKPLSMCCFQFIDDHFHFFQEVVITSARTNDSLEELEAQGILDLQCPFFVVHGDPAGNHNDTRSIKTDYDIIRKYLANCKEGKGVKFFIELPSNHPPIKKRHNLTNAYLKNDLEQTRLTIWGCPTIDKGLRLTVLKKGGSYVEDDSAAHPYQHITTALGYGICETLRRIEMNKPIDPRILGGR